MRIQHVENSDSDVLIELASSIAISYDHLIAAVPHQTADQSYTERNLTVIIEQRAFVRDCLMRGLENSCANIRVEAYACLTDWLDRCHTPDASTVLLLSGHGRATNDLQDHWEKALEALGGGVPVVLLAEEEDPDYIKAALNDGVRGYIPTSMPLSVAIDAIQLVRAGGIYIPASSFLRDRQRSSTLEQSQLRSKPSGLLELFTIRQSAVVQELLKGSSNKIIAYNLAMNESTVKVHVRNIMKKLKARNRTHVAFLLTSDLNGARPPGGQYRRLER
jgi:DNA-binding NarL/FixJ family response regulator